MTHQSASGRVLCPEKGFAHKEAESCNRSLFPGANSVHPEHTPRNLCFQQVLIAYNISK